ncbi:MAG: peptidylprolyl isomerase [Thiohalocapsa sp.]
MVTKSNRRVQMGALRRRSAAILTLVVLGCGPTRAQIQPLDSIVAVVNDDVIVQSELNTAIDLVLPELNARGTAIPSREVLQKQVLDRLILNRLQLQQAENLGIEVDDAALTGAMENIAGRNGLSLAQLRETLEASGVSFDDFREDTRTQILTARLQQQEVLQRISISDAEVDRFLTQEGDSLIERREVQLQHILVALPDSPSSAQVEAARKKTQSLLRRIRGGTSFADVAASSSDGRRALEGGDLGWFPMAEVPSLALEPAQTLAKGEVSEPIQSPSGFHLIRVSDIKGDAPEPLSQTNARHILIRTNEVVSDDDAKRRLSQLRMRIVGGDDFATLARAHSDDTGSALKGGDLGWVNPGDTVPEFEEEMDALSPKAISQPFQSAFGWHIVQVVERRKQDTTDELMRMKAEDAIRERKGEEATEIWLRQLRDEAYVDLRIDIES